MTRSPNKKGEVLHGSVLSDRVVAPGSQTASNRLLMPAEHQIPVSISMKTMAALWGRCDHGNSIVKMDPLD